MNSRLMVKTTTCAEGARKHPGALWNGSRTGRHVLNNSALAVLIIAFPLSWVTEDLVRLPKSLRRKSTERQEQARNFSMRETLCVQDSTYCKASHQRKARGRHCGQVGAQSSRGVVNSPGTSQPHLGHSDSCLGGPFWPALHPTDHNPR